MSKKIISCFYEVNGKKFLVTDNSSILMEIGKNHKISIDLDTEENFGSDYVNSRDKNKVKWAYILQYNFSKLEKGKSKQEIWGYFIEEKGIVPIEKYGIGTNYLQNNQLQITSEESKKLWEGNSFQLLVFVDKPEDGISFPFMPVKSAPEIRGFYFDEQNLIENNKKVGIDDGFYNYSTTIKLYLSTHMLPLASLPHATNVISDGYRCRFRREMGRFTIEN